MTDRAQFEAMLEALINEDQETAKEIFHNIVVAKSREIYEELLAEDFEEESVEEEANPFASSEEGEEEEEAGDEEGADDEEGSDDEEGEESPFGDEEGGEEGEGGDMEDRVMDLEDALDELKAEFEELMGGEAGEEHGAEMGGDEFGGDMGGEMPAMGGEEEMDEFAGLMEYVDKVALPKHGDNGVQTRSPVAGKNDMGGTVANIARGGEAGKAGTAGGLLKPTTSLQDGGNINKPGGNAGKTAFKKKEPGHGAEKKGTGDNGDKSAGSPINGAPGRAK